MRFVLVLVLVVVACGRTTTRFEPFVPIEHRRIVDEVLVVNDIRPLSAHGGVAVGTVDARGNHWERGWAVVSAAVHAAAEVGATHVLVRFRNHTKWGDRPPKGCGALQCNFHLSDVGWGNVLDIFDDGATGLLVYVVRVPPERWSELPPELRPTAPKR